MCGCGKRGDIVRRNKKLNDLLKSKRGAVHKDKKKVIERKRKHKGKHNEKVS